MTEFRPGLEVCAANPPEILRGTRFGLVMNQASIDSGFRTADEVLDESLPGQLAALFGPQHGLWSEQQDNMIETPHVLDPLRKIPVHSLYAHVRKPTPEMLEGLDVLVVDLQDVGTRVYTYLWTLSLCLEAAAEKGIALEDHTAHLIVHGLLHLAGHDHVDSDAQAEAMEALEIAALAKLGIADPYGDRN